MAKLQPAYKDNAHAAALLIATNCRMFIAKHMFEKTGMNNTYVLYGGPGTGKTSMVKMVCAAVGISTAFDNSPPVTAATVPAATSAMSNHKGVMLICNDFPMEPKVGMITITACWSNNAHCLMKHQLRFRYLVAGHEFLCAQHRRQLCWPNSETWQRVNQQRTTHVYEQRHQQRSAIHQ